MSLAKAFEDAAYRAKVALDQTEAQLASLQDELESLQDELESLRDELESLQASRGAEKVYEKLEACSRGLLADYEKAMDAVGVRVTPAQRALQDALYDLDRRKFSAASAANAASVASAASATK